MSGLSGKLRRFVVLAVAALATGAGLIVTAAAPAQAQGAGEVCIFNAPSGAQLGSANMGHVGWAFSVPGSSTWEFGATENASFNWRDAGNEAAVLNTFRGLNGHGIARGYYTQYKCRNTPGSAVTGASNEVNTLYGQGYNLINNNCLTRSIAIFKAYDGSLNNLSSGVATGPNYYFDNWLTGFSGKFVL